MSFTPNTFISSGDKKIGIIAGGQLGKLLALSASDFDVAISIMDGSKQAPASTVCHSFQLGDYSNYNDVYNFGKSVDLLTIELEHVNIEALIKLQEEGLEIHPDPHRLKIIQDKGLQKEFYEKHAIPSSSYILVEDSQDIMDRIDNGEIQLPFVQKSRKHGYDGKGVQIVRNQKDVEELFDVPSVIEELVPIEKELSVIVCKDQLGNIASYDVVEMIFNEVGNLVETLKCPADIENEIKAKALTIAEQTIKAYDIVGLLAVEFFLTKKGELLLNEVAPRPHNSGHHTIETCLTSQFEQHIRAVSGLPLGSTKTISPSVMLNLLGQPNCTGPVFYQHIEECFAIEGARFHIYGKKVTKPLRKMGHVTILDDSIEEATKKAKFIKQTLKIISHD